MERWHCDDQESWWRRASPLALVPALIVAYLVADRTGHGPLNLGTYPSSVGLGVDVGAPMTYGDVISRNEGSTAVIVEDAELQTDDGGATVAEVRVLDTDAVPSGTLLGEAEGYDSMTVMNPGGVELHGLRVRYHVGDRKYVATAAYQLRLCTPRGVMCVAPAPI